MSASLNATLAVSYTHLVTSVKQPVWSKMKMQEEWTGDWTVEVVNGQGQVIDQENFSFSAPL